MRRARSTLRRVLRISAILCALGLFAGCVGKGNAVVRSTREFPAGRGFVCREMTIGSEKRAMWVFVPRSYDGSSRYPAIVFLHGLFEAGSDGRRALTGGLGPVIARDPDDWPFIVLFPQSSGTWRGARRERLVVETLDWALREYQIDRDRVILAGLSYGGLGAWQIGAKHHARFAAIVSVSGFRDTSAAPLLARVPVWAFHSKGDPFVPSRGARIMCRQIESHGGAARLTVFDSMDHDCWDRAVGQSDLVPWMLMQRRDPTLVTAAAE
jgi:predicted peptidase